MSTYYDFDPPIPMNLMDVKQNEFGDEYVDFGDNEYVILAVDDDWAIGCTRNVFVSHKTCCEFFMNQFDSKLIPLD
ncbi:hypothetical protein GCM10011332_33610 [Terasakiella brassicae]|uniref:Uncharacterized protein n=1 Tax=Terasakiella brassicae TaxID=1634917 RepID=A0A917FHL4_9PROT|nr:hypothetical protein [Terasakiella brassicae]GGF76918.1 hypothetical protein GCM10011332_33610 [Terasakiella brassicae]